MKVRSLVLTTLLLGSVPAVQAELVPVGTEFQVNTYTTSNQSYPHVAAAPGGDFVVVWQSGNYAYGPDGSGTAVAAQRYDAGGLAVGSEFIVNAFTTGVQRAPAVSTDALGNFVVSWASGSYYGVGQDGSAAGAFVRQFSSAGSPLGGDVQANTYTPGNQLATVVASDAAGNFVVVWQSGNYYGSGQDGSASGIFAQRFDSTGARVGTEFQVNTYTTGQQALPAVAADPAGNFVVVWQSGDYYSVGEDGDGFGTFARRFDSSGTPLSPEFRVNTYTTGTQRRPAVSADADGNFVVVWESGDYYGAGPDGSRRGIFGQRFDAAGVASGPEFQANTFTFGDQLQPAVAAGLAGSFTVVWRSGNYSAPQDGDDSGVFGQHFAADGSRLGSEFQVNTYTTGDQDMPSVTADSTGGFVVAWESSTYYGGQDGSRTGVFAQRLRATAAKAPVPISGSRLALGTASTKAFSLRSRDTGITLGDGNGSGDDPTLSGGRIRVRSEGFDDTFELPAANWRYVGRPGANEGYRYADPNLVASPIRNVRIVAGRLVRAAGEGPLLGHTLATNPDPVVVVLQLGSTGHRYCLAFGGRARFVPNRLFAASEAPAPIPCPN